jgi:multiple sugar transport system ATP-binding protein
MRAEIAKLQRDLSATTLYVTHDQVEAMTMGDRVAVIRKGELQQVDAPQVLYDRPLNVFVAGFIGSPSMNMVQAGVNRSDGSLVVEFGGQRLRIDEELLMRRPGLKAYEGKEVVLGIRPEDMEDASLSSSTPLDQRISANVDLRESLGSTIIVHFTVRAPVVLTEDTKELAGDVGAEALERLQERAKEATATFVAQLDPRSEVRTSETVELAVNTARLHFFDPETGLGIYDGTGS